MKRCTHSLPLMSAAFFTSLITANSAMADYDKTIEDALKFGDGGAVKFDFNYRWENVNQDAGVTVPASAIQPKTANANTIRTRIGVFITKVYGLSRICRVRRQSCDAGRLQ